MTTFNGWRQTRRPSTTAHRADELAGVEAALATCADSDAEEPWQGATRRFAAVTAVLEEHRRRDDRRLTLVLLGYGALLIAITLIAVLAAGSL
ncbi:hypothetical protein [Streptomyces sp. NPDC055105]|uniref:hypothetical protein n=1 Tax=Streptomyces sp. NPDC055105 TaxID=3365719 RepID=UPI0037CD77F5